MENFTAPNAITLSSVMMTETLKEYHFTDTQIDAILRVMRNKAFVVKWNPSPDDDSFDYNELANLIEDQIVNHPTND